MKKLSLYLACAIGITSLYSCSKDDDGGNPLPNTGAPVETDTANTRYTPAFAGQTRVNSTSTVTSFESMQLTSSLTNPWGIASLPDGRFIVTEKGGTMRIVTATGALGNAFSGIPAVNSAGQGGLLDVALDPAFANNRMIYWTYSETGAGGSVTAVAKGRLADNESGIENTTVIYRSNTPFNGTLHYGSRIVFDRSGNMLVSIGERSDLETRPKAQAVNSSLGKVVRITTNGQPAPGNPSFSESGALPELYTTGHRNPQGLAVHPGTGDIWLSEHGPRGGDEINHLQAGRNYGWPTITYGVEYSGATIGGGITQKEGMEQPVYYWDPVISPSGMIFYQGNKVPEWQDNLFVTSLSGMHIARLVIQNNRVIGEERLLSQEQQRFRDITQGPDGALYAVTDAGRLYKIDKRQ